MNWYNRSHHKAFHDGRTTCTTCGRVFTRINQLRVHHQRDPCGLAGRLSQAAGAPQPAPAQLGENPAADTEPAAPPAALEQERYGGQAD